MKRLALDAALMTLGVGSLAPTLVDPYVDSFAAALADDRKASLATSDKDFARVERKISILWTTAP